MIPALDKALKGVESHIPSGSTIVVGMSGGVDSSVAAALLKELGYAVIGLFMKNWEETDTCPAEVDAQDVAKVAKILSIPFYTVNFAKEYKEEVFELFLDDLRKGFTPNPDVLCNREIKFKKLLEKALALGADGLATGHYARNRFHEKSPNQQESFSLERPADAAKDQTYFLYTATQETLSKTLFPLAHLKKTEVRFLASQLHLPVAQKKDSTGICFIGERNFKTFLRPYLGFSEGEIRSVENELLGKHVGLAYYTIGQRKGLGIGGRGEAWFVVGKDVEKNHLIVAQGENHPALYSKRLVAQEAHWISGKPPTFPLECTSKIRYRQQDQLCRVEQEGSTLRVTFSSPQRAITPRQSVVFYNQNVCLGGAFIQ